MKRLLAGLLLFFITTFAGGFTFIAAASGSLSTSSQTVDCDSSLNVAAGDLLVAVGKWDGTDPSSNFIAATSGNANTFTLETVQDEASICMVVGYKLVADVNDTATFRLTVGTDRSYKAILVMQFRPDGGKTTTKEAGPNPAEGSTGDPVSGNISPSGDDLVVVGGVGIYDYSLVTPQIGSEAADGSEIINIYGAIWYKLYASPQTDINADISFVAAQDNWVCDILAFKSIAAAEKQGAQYKRTPGEAIMTFGLLLSLFLNLMLFIVIYRTRKNYNQKIKCLTAELKLTHDPDYIDAWRGLTEDLGGE